MIEDCCKSSIRPFGVCKCNSSMSGNYCKSILRQYGECKWNFHVRGLLQVNHLINASGTLMSEDCCKSIIIPSGDCKWNFHVRGLLQVNHYTIWRLQVELSCQRIAASQSLYHLVIASGTLSEDCCKSIIRPSCECKWNSHVRVLLQDNH